MSEPSPKALSARGVQIVRGGRTLLSGFDLHARAGRVTALVGPNGAGKSSALKALAGLWPCTGAIEVGGRALGALTLRERARALAYVPQQSLLQRGLSVREIVRQGRYAHDPVWPRAGATEATAVTHALEVTRLHELSARAWHELSGGEQRRVLLARALATEAPIVLLDEPTASLDVAHALRFLGLLRELAAAGRCVVVVLHDLEQVRRWADECVVVDRGRVVAAGATAEVITPDLVRGVYGVEMLERGALSFRLEQGP
jgi:iron complex transport system ATP-binding protein